MTISRRQIFTGSLGLTGLALALTTTPIQASQTRSQNMNNAMLQKLLDRAEIIDTVNKIGLSADLRDWTACRACFTDQLEVDYTSLTGGEPTTIKADALIEQWKKSFANTFKATQHIIANHAVTLNSDRATCISHFRAHHVLIDQSKGKTWTLGGTYNHELVRTNNNWRVSKMQMKWTWEEGTRPS